MTRSLRPGSYKLIRTLAASGAREADIARALRISPNTWRKIRAEDEKALAAWEAGRSVEHEILHDALMQLVAQGNVAAIIFALKTRHGYREKDEAQERGRVTVEFRLPAPLAPEQYVQLLDARSNRTLPVGSS